MYLTPEQRIAESPSLPQLGKVSVEVHPAETLDDRGDMAVRQGAYVRQIDARWEATSAHRILGAGHSFTARRFKSRPRQTPL